MNRTDPAFPFEYHNQTSRYQKSFATDKMVAPGGSEQYGGMTYRDYFAAKALQGLLAKERWEQSGADMFARDAYALADAMLKERAKS